MLKIALAGQPNVGKSVIFNQLTGLNQVVGNWPGKTISKAEGKSKFRGYEFNLIDLPGIYSLSTYSLEEIVSREYIIEEEPDYIINVIDSNQLERNLFFTMQLLMLKKPVIISLNQYDILQKRGYEIDIEKLEELLGVPIIKTVAVHNKGVHEILEKIIRIEKQKIRDTDPYPNLVGKQHVFGKEVEKRLNQIIEEIMVEEIHVKSPLKFFASKLIQLDEYSLKELNNALVDEGKGMFEINKTIIRLKEELEKLHGHSISEIINFEFYSYTSMIANETLILKDKEFQRKIKIHHIIDHLTVHSVWGYFILAGVLLFSYVGVITFGGWIADLFDQAYQNLTPWGIEHLNGPNSWEYKVVWGALVSGLFIGVGGVLPIIVSFYIVLEILQDIGYLPRAAYLMDKFLHYIGVHGKTIIPFLLGFGCTVPAISATMILETEEEKKRAIILTSMIPCAAVQYIVGGLIARYMGMGYAALIYVINFSVMIIIGKMMSDKSSVQESDLIIEFHDFRKPNTQVILKQTWHRSKEFVFYALPLIIIFGFLTELFLEFDILDPINTIFSPVTVYVLGLPIGVGVFLIMGLLRKELNLVLLIRYVEITGVVGGVAAYMTGIEMFVYAVVIILYAPCIATIVMIQHHKGTKFALKIFFGLFGIAILIGGAINWGYNLVIYLQG